MSIGIGKFWPLALFSLILLVAVACGTAAPPTIPAETATATTSPITTGPTAMPTVAPTVTPLPSQVTSAKDSVTLVIDEEPVHLNSLLSGTGLTSSVYRDNLVDPLTWQSGDDRRIVPTSATTGWEQVAADTWRFTLRKGVKFHNGEDWNAQAALPTAEYQGSSVSDSASVGYTGTYTPEAVDEYTLDFKCSQACPIFPNTAFFLGFEAPNFFETSTEEEKAQDTVGFGPYKLAKWDHGVSITEEAYDEYVPAGDHFEFQKPKIKTVIWQWRKEQTVAAAMVNAGEADLAWDVGVDAKQTVNTKFGGSAEVFSLVMNTLWHPELKKVKVRQAIAHAIDCPEIVDSLYYGQTVCRGNILFPGVIGATEENVAPYSYDPDLSKKLLQEADYNPDNKITLISRSSRIPKLTEIDESIGAYLKEAGMNVEVRIVENGIWAAHRDCGIRQAVVEVMRANGENPDTDTPDRADLELALQQGLAEGCVAPMDIWETDPSNETLDFGRQVNYFMNCLSANSYFCDPSEGGVQDQIPSVLAATGVDRQQKLEVLANKMHDEVIHLGIFELPVVYAVNPKLNWEPRFDRRVRANAMWFSP